MLQGDGTGVTGPSPERKYDMQAQDNVLYFAKVSPTAKIPERKTGNAGYDIYADFTLDGFFIHPYETQLVPTGIASAMSSDWYLQVEERGSTGSIGIKKSCGVIDSSYRGEIFIAITNVTNKTICIKKGIDKVDTVGDYIYYPYDKAIAQLVLHRVHNEVTTQEISYKDLKSIPSDRGDGILGSSGK